MRSLSQQEAARADKKRSGKDDHDDMEMEMKMKMKMKTKTKTKTRRSYVPEEIQRDILLRLPVKSVLRFRSVGARLRNLISTREFVADFIKTSHREKADLLLLLSHCGWSHPHDDRWCLRYSTDAARHAHLQEIIAPEFGEPQNETEYDEVRIVDYCQGVVCLICRKRIGCGDVVLWNPSTRKTVAVVPDLLSPWYFDFYSFGFGCVDGDYKLVVVLSTNRFEANVCSLKTREWTTFNCPWPGPSVSNVERVDNINNETAAPPQPPLVLSLWHVIYRYSVFVNGACHWLSTDASVLSFDLRTGRLVEIVESGEYLSQHINVWISIYDGCLSLISETKDHTFEVWVMKEYGVKSSWTRTIDGLQLRCRENKTGKPRR